MAGRATRGWSPTARAPVADSATHRARCGTWAAAQGQQGDVPTVAASTRGYGLASWAWTTRAGLSARAVPASRATASPPTRRPSVAVSATAATAASALGRPHPRRVGGDQQPGVHQRVVDAQPGVAHQQQADHVRQVAARGGQGVDLVAPQRLGVVAPGGQGRGQQRRHQHGHVGSQQGAPPRGAPDRPLDQAVRSTRDLRGAHRATVDGPRTVIATRPQPPLSRRHRSAPRPAAQRGLRIGRTRVRPHDHHTSPPRPSARPCRATRSGARCSTRSPRSPRTSGSSRSWPPPSARRSATSSPTPWASGSARRRRHRRRAAGRGPGAAVPRPPLRAPDVLDRGGAHQRRRHADHRLPGRHRRGHPAGDHDHLRRPAGRDLHRPGTPASAPCPSTPSPPAAARRSTGWRSCSPSPWAPPPATSWPRG